MSFLTQPITIQSIFGTGRKVANINITVIINESASDTLTITKQPVQQGAAITDHAYKEPTTLSMSVFFQDEFGVELKDIYQKLLTLQLTREPFDVITPKRIYENMLISTISQSTDKQTENVLSISLSMQEILIVNVTTTQVPRARQKKKAVTSKTEKAGKKSGLLQGFDAAKGLIKK